MARAKVTERALRARIARAFKRRGHAWHWSRAASEREAFGAWFMTDSDGKVIMSARGKGAPDEDAAGAAERFGLVRAWERVR